MPHQWIIGTVSKHRKIDIDYSKDSSKEHLYCTVRDWTIPTLCPFLTVPWVGLQSVIVAFLDHTLSFLKQK